MTETEKTYRVTYDGSSRDVSATYLANICLEACGGGHTEEQTAKAMAMQEVLLSGNAFVAGGIIWSCEEVTE